YALAGAVLDLTEAGDLARRYWLDDQLDRAVSSIHANIAEGNGRSTPLDYAAFLDRARASAFETEAWLLTTADRRLTGREAQFALAREIDEISAILFTMIRTIRTKHILDSRDHQR
ncbi:MAG TPA: four helix bundle protein, partial [Tepidiformaceae bacterium]|nr:four helix bundle protein [Tepidiformaceae bacterium]